MSRACAPRHRNIGIVFQSYALFPHMTALDNVRFGLECRKVATARCHRGAPTRRSTSSACRRPRRPASRRQLSGGQQQRVALARALVIEPDLLLLDEPLGALDKQLRVQMQTELRSLQRRLGVSAVCVTHDQEEAMSMADRIVVMRDGIVAQDDTPERLFTLPRSAWVCEFVGAGNVLRGPLAPDGTLPLGPGSRIGLCGKPGEAVAVQVPFDAIRLEPCGAGSGLPVTGRRFLGSKVEVHLATPAGILRAHLAPLDAAAFPVGAYAHAHADAAACRMLAEP